MAGDRLKAWYRKLALYIILCVFLFILFSFGLWHIVISGSLVEGWVKDSLRSVGVMAEIDGLKKGFFYNLRIERLNLKDTEDNKLFTIFNIVVRPDYHSFLRFRPSILINATLAGGALKGDISIVDALLNLTIRGAEIGDIGLLRGIGIDGRGDISGTISFNLKESKGNIRFSITNATIKDMTDQVYVPLSLFDLVRGVVELNRGNININSLFLEGKGIYGRIQGSWSGVRDSGFGSGVNGFSEGSRLEVMVNSDFSLPKVVEISLIRYKRSPGYYVIPLSRKMWIRG